MTKQEIRQRIREQFREKTSDELQLASKLVCRKILNSKILANGRVLNVLAYHSLKDEVQTEALIEQLFQMGHNVLLPVVIGDDIILKKYDGISSLKPGAFGISEPTGQVFSADRYGEIDLALIPGRAFTKDGRRLGRGRGYYDRLLPSIHCPKTGICFPFQIVEDIPCEPHDIVLDEVIY